MRDLWRWWRARTGQFSALLFFCAVLIWMSVGLWQSERHFHAVVREVRASFRQQEFVRQCQFAKLLSALEDHLSRQDRDSLARRDEHLRLIQLLSRLVDPNPGTAKK
jgi:hypothetical protein